MASRSFSDRYPLSNAFQLFQGNSEAGVFSFRNNPFADNVVHVGRHALLFTAALLQKPLGRFRLLGLQLGSKVGVSFTQTIQVVSGLGFTGRIGGDILDTQV